MQSIAAAESRIAICTTDPMCPCVRFTLTFQLQDPNSIPSFFVVPKQKKTAYNNPRKLRHESKAKHMLIRKEYIMIYHRWLFIFLGPVCIFGSVVLSSPIRQDDRLQKDVGNGLGALGSGGHKAAPKELESLAIQSAAQRNALNVEYLMISGSSIAELPLTGITAYSYSVVDKRNGDTYSIILDRLGSEVNLEQLRQSERSARTSRSGKLELELAEQIAKANPEETIHVIIRLKAPIDDDKPKDINGTIDGSTGNRMTEAEKKAFEERDEEFDRKTKEYLAARGKRIVPPIVARLTKLGYEIEADEMSLLVYAHLRPDTVRLVATWKEVAEIGLVRNGVPGLNVSRVTTGASVVETRGWDGTGVQVAQVESLGGRVLNTTGQNNPYLSGVVQATNHVCSTVSEHSVAVAGIIRCTNTLPPGARGISPGATLWAGGSCSGAQNQLENRATAAADCYLSLSCR